ncbi:MAG: glycosyltransferase family 2 protein [Candidatus Acidiferrales bacterium]
MKPRVSAIIANRNGAEHLRICLPSLRAQSYQPIEVVVVDNFSSDDSEGVARAFNAKWLPLQENIGLAPALNRGAAASEGDFLLFVNNDMRFDVDFVARLAAYLERDSNAFAADGKQMNWEGTAEGHLATSIATTKCGMFASELVPRLFLSQERSATPRQTFMASAASMLARRHFFDLLHGFDERLPLSYEDVEICCRAWLRGWKTVYVPEAVCWHRVGASSRTRDEKLLLFRGILRGRLLLATKFLPLRYVLATWAASIAGACRDLLTRQSSRIVPRLKEIGDSVLLIPTLMRERKTLHSAANTTTERQLEFFLKLADIERRKNTITRPESVCRAELVRPRTR